MALDLARLDTLDKLLFDIELAPVQGRRFQPTGFPDLGAATFETHSGTQCLLVESAQSMANRLESTCWDDANQHLIPELAGISYVRVERDGHFLTSSILESHRLNSVYIEKSNKGEFHDMLSREMGYDDKKPIDRAAFVRALFKYDASSLLHGVFLESIGGRLRVARAQTAFIEAEGVTIVASGGVKNDHVMPGDKDGEQTAKDGFGNVPFHREEFTADTIKLYANLDLAQIRGYGLGGEATSMLLLLSLFKLRAFLDSKLRLRTACDLKVVDQEIKSTNENFVLPTREELLGGLKPAIKACERLMAKDQGVTTLTYAG